MTGMPVFSARAFTSWEAPELRMPWPIIITGRWAWPINLAALCTSSSVSGGTAGRTAVEFSGNWASISSNCTSRGTSISTGPGRPSRAV